MKHIKSKKLFEKNWIITIDVKDIWENIVKSIDDHHDDEKYNSYMDMLIKKLLSYSNEIEEKLGEDVQLDYIILIENLETTYEIEEFDDGWYTLYDFCDLYDIWLNVF